MSAPPLLYFPGLRVGRETVVIEGSEAAHGSGARRLRPGDRVALFDGEGLCAEGVVTAVERKSPRLEIVIERLERQPEPERRLVLAAALPKGERQGWMLDAATQLGMTGFVPLLCERSVAQPGAQSAQRWRRVLVSACKQSRRSRLPRIGEPQTPAKVLAAARKEKSLLLVADAGGETVVELSRALPPRGTIVLLVGPEGGFSEAELEALDAGGARRIRLGPHILRTEVAAAAIIAAVNQQPGRSAAGK